ncbi:MAG: mandelate racemase/muconate lactonizing enzyme family protein [Clostridia bacterium]|nr:mandelate racemase/muconate lactonizing enzyme family protein [Clostridia bacterium]
MEIAGWDIAGKYFNMPVYALLGGKVRKKVPVYLNLGSGEPKTPEEEAEMTLKLKEKFGYNAVKLYPFDWMRDEDEIADHVYRFRQLIGPDMRLMVDIWREIDVPMVKRLCRKLEKSDVRWLEEPIANDDFRKLKEIHDSTILPIVSGESMFGRRQFKEMMDLGAVDIINPDVSIVGGILELKEIATLAEISYVKVGPHECNSSTAALNATVHAASTMPNLDMVETFPWYFALGDKLSKNQLQVKDGFIEVPDTPGLGIEMDEDFLKSLTYVPRGMNSWEGKE